MSDWYCPNCDFQVFGSKSHCSKCRISRADASRPVSSSSSAVIDAQKRARGDWMCTTCNFIVFGSKTECKKCRQPRPVREEPAPVVYKPLYTPEPPQYVPPTPAPQQYTRAPPMRVYGVVHPDPPARAAVRSKEIQEEEEEKKATPLSSEWQECHSDSGGGTECGICWKKIERPICKECAETIRLAKCSHCKKA